MRAWERGSSGRKVGSCLSASPLGRKQGGALGAEGETNSVGGFPLQCQCTQCTEERVRAVKQQVRASKSSVAKDRTGKSTGEHEKRLLKQHADKNVDKGGTQKSVDWQH